MSRSWWMTCGAIAALGGACWFMGTVYSNGSTDKTLAGGAIIGVCCLVSASAGRGLSILARRHRSVGAPGAATDGGA